MELSLMIFSLHDLWDVNIFIFINSLATAELSSVSLK